MPVQTLTKFMNYNTTNTQSGLSLFHRVLNEMY